MKSPMLFVIFNRPEIARRTFGAIRQAQPKQLFIAADGPRSERPLKRRRLLRRCKKGLYAIKSALP